jgi:hypothetical protein
MLEKIVLGIGHLSIGSGGVGVVKVLVEVYNRKRFFSDVLLINM